MTLRLMRAFEIEANYQKHKQRLTSINAFNAKKKATSTTYKNVELINNFKKQRLTAEIFIEKEKSTHLEQTNAQIQKSLTRVYNREKKDLPGHTSLRRINSKSSLRSLNSESSRIK